ncbi:MAG: hypothetical protein QOD07_2090 [Frankiaceae bacterium]|nr:hypothetical protein [Frankiaceae bacterium]
MTEEAPFDLSKPSPIQRLAQLRAGASEAVVRDRQPSSVQLLMARWGSLEEALWDALATASARRLLVLTGSAGSGKSATLNHLLTREAETGEGRIGEYLADATHSDAPDQDQAQRLAKFFAPFADGQPIPNGPCRAIAMNTGMALRFFTDLPRVSRAPKLSQLEALLRARLNLPALPGSPEPAEWMRDAVLVVNLDHRSTTGVAGALFEEILARFNPADPDGILEGAERCATCQVRDWCWPMANAAAIAGEPGRRALNDAAGDVALARGRQIPPRALWDAAAFLALGGLDLRAADGRDPCFLIADVADSGDEALLLHAMACNGAVGPLLAGTGNLRAATEGSLVAELASRDPSYEPTLDAHKLIADAGLDPDADANLLARTLCGALPNPHPAVARAAQALRAGRGASPDGARLWGRVLARGAWLGGELEGRSGLTEEFADALAAQAVNATEFEDTPTGRALERALSTVEEGLATVFGIATGPDHYYPTSTPTADTPADLMVQVRLIDEGLLGTRPDPVPEANPAGANLVRYRPLTLSLNVANHHVAVDFPLWQLLHDAARGAAPSTVDLERFLALRQAIRVIGVRAAEEADRALLVRERDPGGRKYRIVTRHAATGVLRATEVL